MSTTPATGRLTWATFPYGSQTVPILDFRLDVVAFDTLMQEMALDLRQCAPTIITKAVAAVNELATLLTNLDTTGQVQPLTTLHDKIEDLVDDPQAIAGIQENYQLDWKLNWGLVPPTINGVELIVSGSITLCGTKTYQVTITGLVPELKLTTFMVTKPSGAQVNLLAT